MNLNLNANGRFLAALLLGAFAACAGEPHRPAATKPPLYAGPGSPSSGPEQRLTVAPTPAATPAPAPPPAEVAAAAAAQDDAPRVTVEDLREYLRKGEAVVVDVRGPEAFAAGHIKGAVAATGAELLDVAKRTPPGKRIVIYCS